MILDRLEHLEQYAGISPLLPKAIAFLRDTDLAALPLGRHEIDGDRVFAIAAKDPARSRDAAPLEAHRRYMDIQVVLASTDYMGWKSRVECDKPTADYDAEKDIEFFADRPTAWLAVEAGTFAIFLPGDAHAPLVGRGEIHKVVVKVAVDTSRVAG